MTVSGNESPVSAAHVVVSSDAVALPLLAPDMVATAAVTMRHVVDTMTFAVR